MNQIDLQDKLHTFITNGKEPEAQSVLDKIGYGIAALDACSERLLGWRQFRKNAKGLMGAQKKATRLERKARQIIEALARKFRRIARILFKDNEPVLTELGLFPSPWSGNGKASSNGAAPSQNDGSDTGQAEPVESNGSGRRRRPSMRTAAVIDRWRMMFAKALDLEEEHLARLSERGWSIERITEALQAVETYAEADIDQEQKIKTQRAEVAAAREVRIELEKWYNEARSVTLVALQDLPSDQEARLKEMLGL